MKSKGHIVLVVAEGSSQNLFAGSNKQRDPSGNLKLSDIGQYLVSTISNYLDLNFGESNIKYIDPSYIIRSVPANSADSVLQDILDNMELMLQWQAKQTLR